jgi:hypothetical protein
VTLFEVRGARWLFVGLLSLGGLGLGYAIARLFLLK